MLLVGEFLIDQELSCSNEIVKRSLSFIFHSSFVPFFSKLTATPDTSHNMDSIQIVHEYHRVWIESRLSGFTKTTVSVEFRKNWLGWTSIQWWENRFFPSDKHRNLCSIFRFVPKLIGNVILWLYACWSSKLWWQHLFLGQSIHIKSESTSWVCVGVKQVK